MKRIDYDSLTPRQWRLITQPEFLWVTLASAFAVGIAVGVVLSIFVLWS